MAIRFQVVLSAKGQLLLCNSAAGKAIETTDLRAL